MKARASFFFGRLVLPAAALISFSGSAQATTFYWDQNGTTTGIGGTGAWDLTSSFWRSTSDVGTLGVYGNAVADTAVFGGTAGTVTISGTANANKLTFLTTGYTITGGVLTLSGTAPTIDTGATSATISSVLAGTAGLTKIGTGTLALSGTNTYTGNTTISGGILKLDFTAGGAPATNIISSSSVLKLGGGTLQILGASGGSTQTFASTSFSASTGGQSIISAAPVSGTNPIINLGTMTGSQGALVRFDGAAYNSGASSGTTLGGTAVAATATYNATTNSLGGGIITNSTAGSGYGAYATVGLYDWAAISTGVAGTAQSGSIVGLSQISGGYTVVNTLTTGLFGGNYDLTANAQVGGGSTSISGGLGTIRINTNAAITLSSGRAAGNSVLGALLITPNVGANNTTIALGGSGVALAASRSTGGATGFTVWQNNTLGQLLFNSGYTNGSNSALTGSYTQGGPGTVVMGASNTYTGLTYLDGGTTVITSNGQVGAVATGAAVNINGGTLFGNANFNLDNGAGVNRGIVLNGVGGTLAASAGNTMTVTGVISGTSNAAPLTIGTGTIAGTGAGTANATAVIGSGTVALTGANSYAGGTIAKAGTLQINGINALGGANYGGLTFDGGTLKYATAFSGNGSGDLTSVGTAGITIASGGGTVDTNGNSVTYAGSIGNGGSGSLTKAGAGTLTLASANTYTGGTIINGGTLSAGSSSVFGTGSLTIGSGGTLSSSNSNLSLGNLTLTGGGNIVLGAAGNQITSSGAVSITGVSNSLSLGGSAATAGNTYTLLSGSSLSASGISLTGTGVGGSTVALGSNSTVGRTTYAFSAVGNELQLGVTGGAFNLTWNGGNANWNTTDANWQKDGIGSNIAFFTGDNITISSGDSIAVDGGGVTAGTLAVNNASGTATLTGGAVTAVSLSKSGIGTLQLDSTITGATLAVSGGQLALGAQNQSFANVSLTSGSITGSTAVLTGTGSAFDLQAGSVSAILNGSVGLTKTTGGTVSLSGVNTYTGTTSVNNGTLAVSGSGTLGNGAALTLGGGTVALGGTSQTVGAVSITAAATSGNTLENGSLTGTSYAVSNASDNAIVTASLLANGAAGLNKSGAGTLTLSGANTYTGATLVKNGSLVLDGGANRLLSTGSAVIGDVVTTGKLILGGTTVTNQTFTGLTTTGLGGSVVGGNAANSTLTLDIAGTNTFGGTLGGAGTNENNFALTKSGAGTLTLSVSNTYSGGTQLNGGTLALGSSSAAGTGIITATNGTTISALSGVGGNAVGNAITLSGTNANVTLLNNNASGGINSLINGSADQTLTISNSGGTVVNMNATGKQFQNFLGTVSVASGQSLAFRATSLNNGGDDTLFEINGGLSSRNGGSVALGALSGSGTVSMGSAGLSNVWLTYTIGARDTNATFSGAINDGDTATGKRVGIIKTGTATQTFSGTNNYTGTTTLSQGTLSVGIIGNGGVSGNLGAASNAAGNLVFNGGALQYTGATASTDRNFTINANKTATFDVTTNNLTISGGSTATNGALTKTGAGTLTLSGANAYTGTTTITGGTLALTGSGSLATPNVIVGANTTFDVSGVTGGFTLASGQSISGSGTVAGAMNITGTLTPGNSPGTLSTGSQAWLDGGDYNWQVLDATGVAGTGYDTIAVTGTLDLSSLSTGGFGINLWSLSSILPDVNGDAANFNNQLTQSWTILTTSLGITGFDAADFALSVGANNGAGGFSNTLGDSGAFTIGQTGNNLVLTYSAVPEPNAAMLVGGLGVLALLRRRRNV